MLPCQGVEEFRERAFPGSAAGVPATFALFQIRNKKEMPVDNDEKVTVHEADRFVASPSLDPS